MHSLKSPEPSQSCSQQVWSFVLRAYGDQSEKLIDATRKENSNHGPHMPKGGSDVNKRDKDGTTPLIWAAGEGSPKCSESPAGQGC